MCTTYVRVDAGDIYLWESSDGGFKLKAHFAAAGIRMHVPLKERDASIKKLIPE